MVPATVIALLYLLASLSPFFDSHSYRVFTFLGIFFPYLFVGLCCFIVLVFLFFSKFGFLFLALLPVGWLNIRSSLGMHKGSVFKHQKEAGTIRVASWNVEDFVNCDVRADTPLSPRRNIIAYLKDQDADILCLQDFRIFYNKESYKIFINNFNIIRDSLGFPYYFFPVDYNYSGKYFDMQYGSVIFSKYPIIDTQSYAYDWKHYPEHLAKATLDVNGKKMVVFTTHLRSMFLNFTQTKQFAESTPFLTDIDMKLLTRGSKWQKLSYFDSIHVKQAELVKNQLETCGLPFVFCADLNAVPTSYVYHRIAYGRKDAFLENGFGWGKTYSKMNNAPTLRIDVILGSKNLNFTQFKCEQITKASDHYPLVTDIKY